MKRVGKRITRERKILNIFIRNNYDSHLDELLVHLACDDKWILKLVELAEHMQFK